MISRLLLCTSLALVAMQPAVPALPPLALESYPAAARTAIAAAYEAAMARSGDARAAGDLGRVLHAWEQWDAARGAYARAQALAPGAFEWHYLDAVVLRRLARHDEAAAALRRTVGRAPDYLPAKLMLAETLLDAGNLLESRRLFEGLTDPACAPAVAYGLGTIAAREARHTDAIEYLRRAVALFPEFGAAHYALARLYRALGRRDAAEAALALHTRHGPLWPALDDPVLAGVAALREDTGALVQRGVKRADAGDIEGAIAAHVAALALDPSFAQAHANLIGLYGRVRNWEKAGEHYRRVVELAVNVSDAHYDYGVLLGLQEQWDAAADAYRQALAMNPQHAQARNNLGQILERQQKLDEAAAEYRRAVDSQPTLRIARFNLGRMLIATGRHDEAIVELEKLTEPRDAEAPRYLFALATAHVRAGHREAAVTWATAAKSLAEHHGDTALAAAIARDLARIR